MVIWWTVVSKIFVPKTTKIWSSLLKLLIMSKIFYTGRSVHIIRIICFTVVLACSIVFNLILFYRTPVIHLFSRTHEPAATRVPPHRQPPSGQVQHYCTHQLGLSTELTSPTRVGLVMKWHIHTLKWTIILQAHTAFYPQRDGK